MDAHKSPRKSRMDSVFVFVAGCCIRSSSASAAGEKSGRKPRSNIARRVMFERGFLPDFSPAALAELDRMQHPATNTNTESILDLRGLLWASIDNDDSRDLDQLTVAEAFPDEVVKILVAVADVDSLV